MKVRFGFIKVLAQRFVNGESIPLFANNNVNRAINVHIKRIEKAKTKRKGY